jgi:hypothetical protein
MGRCRVACVLTLVVFFIGNEVVWISFTSLSTSVVGAQLVAYLPPLDIGSELAFGFNSLST